jgi:hypothetical protein
LTDYRIMNNLEKKEKVPESVTGKIQREWEHG